MPTNAIMPEMNVVAKNDQGVTKAPPTIPTPVLNKKTDPKEHAVMQSPKPKE